MPLAANPHEVRVCLGKACSPIWAKISVTEFSVFTRDILNGSCLFDSDAWPGVGWYTRVAATVLFAQEGDGAGRQQASTKR